MRFLKFLVFSISLFSIFSQSSPAQWNLQTSGTTNNLYSVYFITNNTGFIAGESGTILKTTNSSGLWSSLNSGAAYDLHGIRFVNALTGWVVGDTGTILRTTNRGNSWIAQSSGTQKNLRSVFFVTTRIGYIVGDSVILKTTNRGGSWIALSADNMNFLYSVYFINSNTGWIAGNSLLKTTNGGANWQTILSHADGRSIFFANSSTGWYSGFEYRLAKSTDGGVTWGSVPLDSPPATFTGIQFLNSNTGWFTSSHAFGGRVMMTTNGGSNWNEDYPTTYNRRLFAIYMRQVNKGWAVGENGTILSRGTFTEISNNETGIPKSFSLSQNYPNPFNPSTKFRIEIAKSSFVKVSVFDILGREVAEPVDQNLQPGYYEVSWDASDYPSGVYFYRLSVNDENLSFTKKMLLVK